MKRTLLKLFTFSIIVILLFISVKFFILNKNLKKSLPYLLNGEKITYFDLIDKDGTITNINSLKEKKSAVLFIFSRPCSPCNKNIVFWNKISEITKNKANIYGIIVSNMTDVYNLTEHKKLNFKVFIPEDINLFIKNFRLKLNSSQTIVYKNGIEYLKIGTLGSKDAIEVIQKVKSLL